MGAAWPQGNLPFLKLAEKSCFLTWPTEWKWRKTGRSSGVEVAWLFCDQIVVAADKTKQEPKIISFSFHLVIFTFPVPWAAFQRKGQAVLPWAKFEGRATQETKQEGLNRRNWMTWMKECNVHTQAKEAGALWEGKLGSSWQVHSINMAQVIQDGRQNNGGRLIWKLWEL